MEENKKKILLVEDLLIVAKSVKSGLERMGYEVVDIVRTGQEAIQKAGDFLPDIILMDIILEGEMDGIDCSKIIQKEYDIPIIYLTANSDEMIMKRARETTPYGYILKPFEDQEIRIVIEMALYKHQTEKEIRESREWFFTILKSIGDGVVSADMDGNINFMNPVAEAYTSFKETDAVGKQLSDVFYVLDGGTGKKIPDPVKHMKENGYCVITSKNAVLVNQKGLEVQIEYQISPIMNDEGQITGRGFVTVFHESKY